MYLQSSLYKSRILIAVSGGKDSLCLVKVIKDLQTVYSWKVGLVHCDHRWREDSRRNAQIVYQIAKEYNFTFYLGINKQYLVKESTARQWRYYTLFNVAVQYQYNVVLTAHTLSDRVETFFYNLSRGSSIDGVNSLPFAKKVNNNLFLYRPLVQISQNDTLWLCKYFCLPVWADSTNLENKQRRNRIREELLPYLRYYLNPRIDSKVISFLNKLSLQTDYFKSYIRNIYAKIIHPALVALKVAEFRKIHRVLQIEILEILFKQTKISLEESNTAQLVLEYLHGSQSSSHILVSSNYIVIHTASYLYFCQNKDMIIRTSTI